MRKQRRRISIWKMVLLRKSGNDEARLESSEKRSD